MRLDADTVDSVFLVMILCRETLCESFTLLFGNRSLIARWLNSGLLILACLLFSSVQCLKFLAIYFYPCVSLEVSR